MGLWQLPLQRVVSGFWSCIFVMHPRHVQGAPHREKTGAGARSAGVHMLILEVDELEKAGRYFADSCEVIHAVHLLGPGGTGGVVRRFSVFRSRQSQAANTTPAHHAR